MAGWLGNSAAGAALWPMMDDFTFLEKIAGTEHRRLSRMAIRGCLSRIGKTETEETWLVRILWLQHLTNSMIKNRTTDFRVAEGAGLVDVWEAFSERARKEASSPKSPLISLLHKQVMCDKLWRYLTHDVMLLPPCVRSSVVSVVHGLYMQAYGTGIPAPYKEAIDLPREGGQKGPMSFWLPVKEHERVYRRFIYRGPTVKPEPPKNLVMQSQAPKRPKLLITSAGSVPLGS